MNLSTKIAGMILTFLGMSMASFATPSVPEIDGSSLSTGVTLIAGALLVARGRRRK